MDRPSIFIHVNGQERQPPQQYLGDKANVGLQ